MNVFVCLQLYKMRDCASADALKWSLISKLSLKMIENNILEGKGH